MSQTESTTGARQPSPADSEPVPLARALGELLEVSDERDQQLVRRLQQLAYELGRRSGFEDGYRAGRADESADWMACIGPARAAARDQAAGRTHAEVERRRWELRGEARTRRTFSQGHPDDFPGRVAS